jgi:hypothetical protein
MLQPINYFHLFLLSSSLSRRFNAFELFDFAPCLFELVVDVVLIRNDLRITKKLLLGLAYFQFDVVGAALLNRSF